jgi:hypothetical protein
MEVTAERRKRRKSLEPINPPPHAPLRCAHVRGGRYAQIFMEACPHKDLSHDVIGAAQGQDVGAEPCPRSGVSAERRHSRSNFQRRSSEAPLRRGAWCRGAVERRRRTGETPGLRPRVRGVGRMGRMGIMVAGGTRSGTGETPIRLLGKVSIFGTVGER